MRDCDSRPVSTPDRREKSDSRLLLSKRCAAGLLVIVCVVALVRFMLSFPPPEYRTPIKPHRTINYKTNIFKLAFSPDSSLLAACGYSTYVKLFDTRTGKTVNTLGRHGHRISSLAFSPDGKLLATAGADKDGSIRIWDTRSGTLIRKLTAAKSGAISHSVAFSADGAHLVSVSDKSGIKLWEVRKDFLSWRLGKPTTDYSDLAVAGNNTLVVSEMGEHNSILEIWDLAGKRVRQTISLKSLPQSRPDSSWVPLVTSLALSPNGKRVAVSFLDGDVGVWNTVTGKPDRTEFENSYGTRYLVFSPNGRSVAGSGFDGRVLLWDVETGKEYLVLNGFDGLAFSPDGKQIAAGFVEAINLWNLDQALKDARQAKQKKREAAKSDRGVIALLLTFWSCGLAYAGYLFIRSLVGITSRELVRAVVVILIVFGILLLLLMPLLGLFGLNAAGLG